MTIEEFNSAARPSIDRLDAFAAKHALVGVAKPDHICFKCASRKEFESMREMLESETLYLHQTIISGRRIAYLRFKNDIETSLGPISFLELSDQKPDGSQQSGFDHIEVFPTSLPYSEYVEHFKKTEQVVEVVRPHHTTHDIDIGDGFLFRCTAEPLVEKIKREEM